VSRFRAGEVDYLQGQTLGRLATVGPDGQPHVIPVTYQFNADEDAIDIGGIDFAGGKKWHDMQGNPKVTFLVDDRLTGPPRARAVEIRGTAELHETGGSAINPRFPNFVEQFVRIRPTHIVSWGMETGGTTGAGYRTDSRSVG
jgi:pyridoxamine 5'-phosphate oxidase family protein